MYAFEFKRISFYRISIDSYYCPDPSYPESLI